jgi:ribosomal protein L39E
MVFRHKPIKKRFANYHKETKYAPAWAVLKKFGKIMHPSVLTKKKRFWRRHTIDE